MASHGLTGLGSPDGTDVRAGFIQEIGGSVPGICVPLCAPADWTFVVKCDGGTRSFWIFLETAGEVKSVGTMSLSFPKLCLSMFNTYH